MIKVVARRRSGFIHDVEIEGGHTIVVDEPESSGGANAGPSPVRLVGAALASCTAITVEMYAERQEWDIGNISVEVEIDYDGAAPRAFEVILELPGGLSEQQQEKLRVIAGKCPVHRALTAETPVTITDRVRPA